MWTRLLVPHDFSDCAARALEVARGLARRDAAAITLLHVSPLPTNLARGARVALGGGAGETPIEDLARAGAMRRLESIAAPVRAEGIEVHVAAVATASEDVATAVLRAAREAGSDAIVMGTHGRTGLAHLLLGSVAERVIRGASVPVVTVCVHAGEAEPTLEERVAEDELAG